MRHDVSNCLWRAGWVRHEGTMDDLGECVAETGCSRVGRWEWRTEGPAYCAQHAHQGVVYYGRCLARRKS